MTDPVKALADAARSLVDESDYVGSGFDMSAPHRLFARLRKAIAVYDAAQAQPAHRPVGIAGERDPDHPCEEFAPGSPNPGMCFGDGHYLCKECRHYVPEDTTEETTNG